jgi:hypothetical protein
MNLKEIEIEVQRIVRSWLPNEAWGYNEATTDIMKLIHSVLTTQNKDIKESATGVCLECGAIAGLHYGNCSRLFNNSPSIEDIKIVFKYMRDINKELDYNFEVEVFEKQIDALENHSMWQAIYHGELERLLSEDQIKCARESTSKKWHEAMGDFRTKEGI